jgi:hypothetical protein
VAIVNRPKTAGRGESVCLAGLSIWRVERDVLRDRSLPAVAVREQALLVVVELLGCLGRELEVWSRTIASTGQASWQKPQ